MTDAEDRMTGKPALSGQTVVVIGGSAGIGRDAARLAWVQYAEAIVTRRNPDRLRDAADEFCARGTWSADHRENPRGQHAVHKNPLDDRMQ